MPAPVSVVIVSRGRPAALDLCLTGVAQLDHPAFEVVVVACPEGAARVRSRPDAAHLKLVAFDEANISEARNRGIARAAGGIVAFLDDDAVPEPTWLTHLAAPFAEARVAAAGGYVRGRNGIDFQWRARTVTATGDEAELPLSGAAPRVVAPSEATLKLQGTNMAWRRSVLAELGGFDPAFRFYLDETDLDLRRADAGLSAAAVPLAQVHHGYAESTRRSRDRTPRDLTEIGASMAVFLRKHCPEAQRDSAWRTFRAAQRQRLVVLMQRGPLGPDDAWRLLRGLDRGAREGARRAAVTPAPLSASETRFQPYPGRPGALRSVVAGRAWSRAALRREAAARAAAGEIVSLFRFSHTTLYHTVHFHPDGYWEQAGGLWGRSTRLGRLIRPGLFRRRLQLEVVRVSTVRGIDTTAQTGIPGTGKDTRERI
ncbi:glycosyltransferase family 2 protein [Salipiger mucosus]|uniref:Glycosyl transferase, family 2 n=1 Tax=Salipiger mucosus DSM 16094 TaxID=1123237 RepID=S9QRS9_9RHOB|nr:glycosyltransferase [Salipiger mucosus]EPX82342.1 Glycosyl transferase, family 2 [Salipiger mucosus DSM 16094]